MQKSTAIHIAKSLVRFFLQTISTIVGLFSSSQPTRITRIEPRDDNILRKPATVLARAIKSGELKSEQVVETFIARIELVNPVINAVVCKHYEAALKRAREIDALLEEARTNAAVAAANRELLAAPLLGVPFTCKESVALAGSPYAAGLPARKNIKAERSNPAVDRLIKRAGAIPLATTNTPCMNMWYDSYNLLYGRTLNPYDLSRIPGGSSGGEGAILAAAGSCLGVGSDLGGSIRIPANYCGVFGHKPSPGLLSVEGMYPARQVDKMSTVGPMTRFACDLRPALEAMITDEERLAKLRLDEPVDLHKIKLFYCEDMGDSLTSRCDSDVRGALQAAVEHISSTYRVKASKITLSEFKYGATLWKSETEGTFLLGPHEAHDGIVVHNPLWQFIKSFVGMNEIPYSSMLAFALYKLGFEVNSPSHLRMKERAKQLRATFNTMLGTNGVLLMPAFNSVAPKHAQALFQLGNVSYTAVVNCLHAPVTQCPINKSKVNGLPVGIQVVAVEDQDRLCLAVACELDKAFGGWKPAE